MADRQDRATAYASMEEWEKRCNDYSGETVHDLANEVLRLRAAGDALAHAMTQVASDEDWSAALRGWEARRER